MAGKKRKRRQSNGFIFSSHLFLFSSSFIVEDWGPCSAQCGEGIRERRVKCKIFLEFSKTVATLPDHKCPGPKPAETEICFAGLCDAGVKEKKKKRKKAKGKKGKKNKADTVATTEAAVVEDDDVDDEVAGETMDVQGDALSYDWDKGPNVLSLRMQKKTKFRWKEVGFTACSESCLGGRKLYPMQNFGNDNFSLSKFSLIFYLLQRFKMLRLGQTKS